MFQYQTIKSARCKTCCQQSALVLVRDNYYKLQLDNTQATICTIYSYHKLQ